MKKCLITSLMAAVTLVGSVISAPKQDADNFVRSEDSTEVKAIVEVATNLEGLNEEEIYASQNKVINSIKAKVTRDFDVVERYHVLNNAFVIEVNSETDFVAKNEEFKSLVNDIASAILTNDVKTNEDVLKLNVDGGTVEDLIINKTAKIGEKLSFRRFAKLTKEDNQVFASYIHMGGKIAVLVKLNGTDENVAKDVAMHAAAMRPSVVRRSELKEEDVNKEREILTEQAINEGKPKEIAVRMVEGRLLKYYQETCLEEQSFVKDDSMSVLEFVTSNNCTIDAMVRFEVGEGMEKREENFAEEVAKQMGN